MADLSPPILHEAGLPEALEADFGLMSMRERLEFLGGSATIERVSDNAFRLMLDAPLDGISDVRGLCATIRGGDTAGVASILVAGASTRIGIRVVVDDHQTIRQGLSAMLLDEPDFTLVGEACDGLEAIEQKVAEARCRVDGLFDA